MIKITMDFETRSAAPLKKVAAYEYSMDPSTIVTCLGFKSELNSKIYLFDFYTMQKAFDELDLNFKNAWLKWVKNSKYIFSAHNAFFEQCIYQNVLVARLGWPPIPIHKWRCTAVKAAAVAIPRNLADAGAVMNLTTQKDYEGHRVMMKLCKPTAAWVKWDKAHQKFLAKGLESPLLGSEPNKFWCPGTAPEDYEKLYRYCKIDVLTEEKLDASLPDLSFEEQRLWFIDQKINMRGVQVDMPVVNKISDIMAKEARTMNTELDQLTMGLVSTGNSRAQILEFLMLEGIELPDLRAKTVDDFLANGDLIGDAKKLLEIRRALSKASTAKYQKFLMCAKSDGRVRDLFLMNAASTGRWGGKNVQPQNFPRGIIKDIDLAIENIKNVSTENLKLLYGENLMPLFSSVLRGMFIASKGKELFVEDYNAIETRVLWWLADHQKGLDIFRKGQDPYREMAAAIYKKSLLEINDDERQVGKAAVLGCGYQMGGKKFMTSAWDVYRAKVDLDLAKVAVTAYREMHSPVTELWSNYEQACIYAIENPGEKYRVGLVKFIFENEFLWIELPSGRKLAYKDPELEMSKVLIMTNADNDRIYAQNMFMYQEAIEAGYKKTSEFDAKKIKYWAINQKAKKVDCVIPKWTRETTYGGKITENIVQAVSRDLLAESIVRAEKAGFNVLMHSHDECVSEAPIGKFTSEQYKEIMEALPKWAEGLPLKTGGWKGFRYKKG